MTVALQVLTVMVVTFISIFLILTLVSMSVHWKNYVYYKMTYFAILNCTYVMVRNSYSQQTYHRPDDPNPYSNDEIIFFLDNGREVDSIKLLSRGQHYIHDKGGIDLYARYWFRKIMKVRDKYNHEIHLIQRANQLIEDYTGNNYYINVPRRTFKFFRG
jgi:hypothetical protein